MTLLVRDEVDVVAANVAFHLDNGVDFVIATDNGSRDGTRDVLDEFQRQGVLKVIDEPVQDFSQSRWVTRMALMARDQFGADWILNNDADEFWYPLRGDLKSELETTSANVLEYGRWNMLCAWSADEAAAWTSRLRYRVKEPLPIPHLEDPMVDVLEQPYYYWDLPTKVLSRAEGIVRVEQGNHSVEIANRKQRRGGNVVILHYPFRTRSQFLHKVVRGGEAYARNSSLPASIGWHWRRWYQKVRSGDERDVFAEILPDVPRLEADLANGRLVECELELLEQGARSRAVGLP